MTITDEINKLTVAEGGKPVYTGAISDALANYMKAKKESGEGLNIAEILQNHNNSGSKVSPSGVTFIGYGGRTEHSKKATSLPANPSRKGLIPQGWNWSLEDIQDYMSKYPEAVVTVGQMYTTRSGASEFVIGLTEEMIKYAVTIAMKVNAEVEIDWGDGSEHYTYTGTDSQMSTVVLAQHKYAKSGDYTIKLFVRDGVIEPCGFTLGPVGMAWTTTSAQIPANFWQFGNTMLKSLHIGSGIETIGAYAFYNCFDLAELTIPHGVTAIGNYAFQRCENLSELTIPDGVTTIGSYAFYVCSKLAKLSLPSSLTSIGSNAFYSCNALTDIAIPESMTAIDNYVFNGCRALASLTIPDTVTSIGYGAISNSYALTKLLLPDSVETINSQAFSGHKAVTELTIPDGIETIDQQVFSGFNSLTELTIPDSVTTIGQQAFTGCNSLVELTIPNGVTTIGVNAFSDCYDLTELTIPDSVTSIGQRAFFGCYSLIELTLPSGITSVANLTFAGCFSLSSLTIPSTITSIGSMAFFNCTSLTEVHCLRDTPPTLAADSFNGLPSDAVIYVPAASVSSYKAASNWSAYADQIVAES